jgi:hypothetical protein
VGSCSDQKIRYDAAAREIVRLARKLEQEPNAAASQLSICVAARLDAGADGAIERAIQRSPSMAVGRRIRCYAEALSERIERSQGRLKTSSCLFCIPIVLEYRSPESAIEFDNSLRWIEQSNQMDGFPYARRPGDAATIILPHFFSFEELAGLHFSEIRSVTRLLAQSYSNAQKAVGSFQRRVRHIRPARSFIRYFVGHRITPAGQAETDGLEALCRWFEEGLEGFFPAARQIRCFSSGSFFDDLYQGMYLYQNLRIRQAVEELTLAVRSSDGIAAVLRIGSGLLQVAFFHEGQLWQHHGYSLRMRPGENPIRFAARVKKLLMNCGVSTFRVCVDKRRTIPAVLPPYIAENRRFLTSAVVIPI